MTDAAVMIHRQPKKRVAVFIDGTWNVEDNNTNVWRLYSLCSKVGTDGLEQVRYYTKGVGTAFGEKVRGGWFGYGIDEIIRETYEWLIGHYNAGDDLFIFGFSRGAYAARALAGFVADCGIVRSGSPIGVGELFARYQKGEAARTLYRLLDLHRQGDLKDASPLERWMLRYAAPADVTMVGVWDTVGALTGERGWMETGLRQSILNEFHALAIDEHRRKFAPTLLTINSRPPAPSAHRDIACVEQRWFVGAHANVGGGYESDLLPQLPLGWLMRKASRLHMSFREDLVVDADVCRAPVRDSFAEFAYGLYRIVMLWRPYHRPVGADPVHSGAVVTTNVNETVDSSVFERCRLNGEYAPPNLLEWARRRKIDPKKIIGSVRADDLSPVMDD